MAAFANSSNLTSVTLPDGVESIGANAFMNTKIDHLIIPDTTTTIGATILRGTGANGTKVYARRASAPVGWTSTWNNNNAQTVVDFKSDFDPEIEYIHTGTGLAVRSFQPFVSSSATDVYIPSHENGLLVEYIDQSAFDYTDARSITVGYTDEAPVVINDMAFAFLENVETITINREVEWSSSMMVFAGSTMTTVILPKTITNIPDYAFSFGLPENSNLTDIHFITPQDIDEDEAKALASTITPTGTVILPKSVTSIGYGAFDHADLIENLHIRSTVENVEAGAFSGWTDEQTLWIDYPGYVGSWEIGWNDNCEAVIEHVTRYTVTYAPNQPAFASSTVDGETPESNPIIGTATQLSENGFSLDGWRVTRWDTRADGTGTSYPLLSTINIASATTSTVVVLYAQWAPNTYNVIFDSNIPNGAGPLQGSMLNQSLAYDAPVRLTINEFELDGYNFLGWSLDSAFVGSPVPFTDGQLTPNVTSENGATVTLYAIWGEKIKNISTAAEFNNIRNNPSGHYKLTASINLAGFYPWIPIPNFTGILEGNNYAISNVDISYTIPAGGLYEDVNLGLFAKFNGVASNLRFNNTTVDVTNQVQTGTGWIRAGLFAGTIGPNASISNVDYRGINAWVTVKREMSEVGLIAGEMTGGTVNRAYNHSAMTFEVDGQGHLGGFIGVMRGGSLINCSASYSMGPLVINYTRVANDRGVGFLVGKIESADTIEDNSISGARFHILNASGGTLFGILCGIGNAGSANEWGYDPMYGPSQYYGTNYLGYWNNLVRIGAGSYATVDQVPFGRTYP